MKPLQVWAGVECTVNRVGGTYYNQLDRSGHSGRLCDLDRIAELGIRTLRYPILWELNAPDLDGHSDWKWATERLNRLRVLQIAPIVGLVHHGSGPAYTCLTDERFVTGLAAYAGNVAARFPWVEWYTPVNEPLTTARFSGLYGLWYPHGRDNRTFARSLVNQCRATILSMRAIRRINPNAKLLQTDDLGTTYSTPAMQYQAAFDNERRWLGWDLICGRVGSGHPLRLFLLSSGISIRELDWLCEFACPPDMIGINHYVTSDRFLDERLDRYPAEYWGSNNRERYADVDAVRVIEPPQASWTNSLRAAWDRFQLPLALTEVHLGCTREEQLRWFFGAWTAAQEARKQEIQVVGVTAWALFGSFDWDSLLTRDEGHYEPGVFDIRGPAPRPTALAHLVRELIHGRSPRNPVLEYAGWWQRSRRLVFGVDSPEGLDSRIENPAGRAGGQPLLVWSSGAVAGAFSRACDERGLAHRVCSRALIEGDTEAIGAIIDQVKPWAVIYAENRVRNSHHESEPCPPETVAPGHVLAAHSARHDLPVLMLCIAAQPSRTDVEAAPGTGNGMSEPDLLALVHSTLDLLIDRHASG